MLAILATGVSLAVARPAVALRHEATADLAEAAATGNGTAAEAVLIIVIEAVRHLLAKLHELNVVNAVGFVVRGLIRVPLDLEVDVALRGQREVAGGGDLPVVVVAAPAHSGRMVAEVKRAGVPALAAVDLDGGALVVPAVDHDEVELNLVVAGGVVVELLADDSWMKACSRSLPQA